MAGLLGSFFNFVDPILDEVDPGHNYVQTWTTGRSDTKGQSPYFETIAPMIVDYFLPGVGSAIGALDGASTGNWTKAGLSALGSYAQMGSLGTAAADGANGGLAATEASSGLSSTSGAAPGVVVDSSAAAIPTTDYATAYGTNTYGNGFDSGGLMSNAEPLNLGPSNTFGQTSANGFGYNGLSSAGDSAASSQFMTIPSSQFSTAAGVGGVGQGLEGTASAAGAGSNVSNGSNWGKVAQNAGKLYLQQTQNAEQQAKQRAMMQQANARNAMPMGDAGTQSRPAQSLQSVSPYAQFSGGYNPRRYGRKPGLLG